MKKNICLAFCTITLFSLWHSNATSSEFTCEKIKDKVTRDSCIQDRTERGNEAVFKKRKKNVNLIANITSTCTLSGAGLAKCTFSNSGNVKGSLCKYFVLVPTDNDDEKQFYKPLMFVLIGERNRTEKVMQNIQELKQKIALGKTNRKELLFSSFYLNNENMLISDDPICSGLVEAGDIRQVTATPFFMGQSLHNSCSLSRGDRIPWNESCNFTTIDEEKIITMLETL